MSRKEQRKEKTKEETKEGTTEQRKIKEGRKGEAYRTRSTLPIFSLGNVLTTLIHRTT
jgi:hypothetical protein